MAWSPFSNEEVGGIYELEAKVKGGYRNSRRGVSDMNNNGGRGGGGGGGAGGGYAPSRAKRGSFWGSRTWRHRLPINIEALIKLGERKRRRIMVGGVRRGSQCNS